MMRTLLAGPLAATLLAACYPGADAPTARQVSSREPSRGAVSNLHPSALSPSGRLSWEASRKQGAVRHVARMPQARSAVATSAAVQAHADALSGEFKHFALNALLVSLLDDDSPPRWSDPGFLNASSLVLSCVSSRVEVDGHPLIPGAPLPSRAFRMAWDMDRCALFNGPISLSGRVELVVYHDGDQYSAILQPRHLLLESALGERATLDQPFSATTPLGSPTPS